MDSFKFNSLNYQDTNSLVDAQNKIIDALTKDKKTLLQDEGNYAAFREKEKARQMKQLGDIIAGVPKFKKALDAAKAKKDAEKEQKKHEDNKDVVESDYSFNTTPPTPTPTPTTKEGKLEDAKKENEKSLISFVQGKGDENTPESTVIQRELVKERQGKSTSINSPSAAKSYAIQSASSFWGTGQAYLHGAEYGQFDLVEEKKQEYLGYVANTPEYKSLSPRNKKIFWSTIKAENLNYFNKAGRAYTEKTRTLYKATRQHELLDNIKSDGGAAIEEYIFKHEYYGNKKNTPQAINQLIDDLTELEKDGHVTAETYTKILRGYVTDRSSKKPKKIADLNNGLSKWIQGRQVTLQTKENEDKINRWKNEAQTDIEEGEKEFEKFQTENPDATDEDEFEWRKDWLTNAYKRHKHVLPGDLIWTQWKDGLTRLDGPDHTITLERLVEDYNKDTPLDDAMYQSLPNYWKKQFQKAIVGNDEEEGSSGKSIGTGKLKFKSYFNALQKGGGWDTWVMKQMKITDIDSAQTNPKFGWITFQGKEDYVTKFEELKKIGSVRDAQSGALAFIKGKYKEYYDNPIEEGFDERIVSSITEGRQDIQPRIRASKSQDELLAILNQPTLWAGEEVAIEELIKWSRGYGDFPQYYRQLDYFKDMTPREIAVHRMEIHQAREEKNEAVDNAIKAIYKGVELDKKLYDSLSIDTSRLLTNHNTPSRTYRAEVQEKENTDLYEHVKVNDDPNAYKPANPYLDYVPSGNLSEMPLIEVLTESGQKRLKALGLYGLNPRDIMNVISEEEKTNGFLDTTFDEKLQTELKRRLARLAANKSNRYGALVENPNPLPNLIPEDSVTLTEAFGPQDWESIPPNILETYLKELQKLN